MRPAPTAIGGEGHHRGAGVTVGTWAVLLLGGRGGGVEVKECAIGVSMCVSSRRRVDVCEGEGGCV